MHDRNLALDNLRALAMVAGVFFHAALAHSPLVAPVFPTADVSQAPALDLVLWPLHLVRMPIFFVIAGVLAARSVSRRGMGGFMADRARRVLLPLLVLAPLFHVLMGAMVLHAARTVQHPGALLRWIRDAMDAGQLESWPPGTGHLWFLYVLMLLCVLLWTARLLMPAGVKSWLRDLPLSAWVVGLPLWCMLPFASTTAPHAAPEGLLPQFWALAVFGGFFAFGYVAWPRLAELAHARWLAMLTSAGGVACAAFLVQLGPLQPQAGWVLGAASACTSVWWSLALLGVAQRTLVVDARWLRYLAEASYWVYLVHLPVLFALQFAWLDVAAPWLVKLPLAVLVTLALSLLSHEVLVRRGGLGRWLLGGKAERTASASRLRV